MLFHTRCPSGKRPNVYILHTAAFEGSGSDLAMNAIDGIKIPSTHQTNHTMYVAIIRLPVCRPISPCVQVASILSFNISLSRIKSQSANEVLSTRCQPYGYKTGRARIYLTLRPNLLVLPDARASYYRLPYPPSASSRLR